MIGDRDLRIKRERNSTPWLTDIIWEAATAAEARATSSTSETPIEDDHLPFLEAGVPSVDIIDLDYPPGTRRTTRSTRSAPSLQVVGDVLLAALPEIEKRLLEALRHDESCQREPERIRTMRAACQRDSDPSSARAARLLASGFDAAEPSLTRRELRPGSPAPSAPYARRFGRREHSLDDLVGHRQPALLQPVDDVRLAGHRTDLDLLLATDQARRNAGIDGVQSA